MKSMLDVVRCLVLACVLGITFILGAAAQTVGAPTNVDCRRWDAALVETFHLALLGAVLVPLLLAPLLGWLAPRFWWATEPLRRSAVAFSVVVLVSVGVGVLWYYTTDPRYFDCGNNSFGAEGLFYGVLAANQAAFLSWPWMALSLLLASFFGSVTALFIQRFLARRAGIRRRLGRTAQ